MEFQSLHIDEGVAAKAPPSPRSPENDPAKFRFKRRSSIAVDQSEVFSMDYSTDSRFLATGCGDGSVRVFNSVGRLSYVMNVDSQSRLPVTCLRWRPPTSASQTKNVLVVASADGTLTHWHAGSQKKLYSIEETDNQIFSVEYRGDGEQFATAGRDAAVRIYDESTKSLLQTMKTGAGSSGVAGHSNRVYALKYKADDPNVLVSGGWDNTVLVWDLRAGEAVRCIYGPHICGEALDMSGDQILTGSWRPKDALQLWDFGTGKLVRDVAWSGQRDASGDGSGEEPKQPPAPEMLYAAKFSPNGRYIAAGGCGTNEGKLFDSENDYKVVDRQFMGEKGIYTLAFAPNGKKLSFAGGSRNVAVLDLAQ